MKPTFSCANALSRTALILGSLLASAGGVGVAEASFVTVGTNNGPANVFPLGSNAGLLYRGEYQQVYTSAAFTGPVSINSIGFATTTANGLSASDTITVGLSTTAATLSTISTNYAANKGADFQTVFAGTISYTALSNGTFDVVIPTSAFVYDPSKGNLLVDIFVTTSSGSQIPFEATTDAVTSRIYNSNGSGTPTRDINYGLVTQFGVSAVPEPGSVALLAIGGLGVLTGIARRHRAALRSA